MKSADPRYVFGLAALLSVGMLAVGGWAVLLQWYPPPLWRASGILRLVVYALSSHALVTMLLLLPWRNRQRQFAEAGRKDVAVLVLLLAVTWLLSLSFLAQGRPVALVFAADRIVWVRASDLRATEFALPGVVPISEIRWTGTVPLLAARPSTDSERLDSIGLAMAGYDLPQRPSRWEAAERQRAAIEERIRRASQLPSMNLPTSNQRWLGRLPLDGVPGEWSVLVSESLDDYRLEPSTDH